MSHMQASKTLKRKRKPTTCTAFCLLKRSSIFICFSPSTMLWISKKSFSIPRLIRSDGPGRISFCALFGKNGKKESLNKGRKEGPHHRGNWFSWYAHRSHAPCFGREEPACNGV